MLPHYICQHFKPTPFIGVASQGTLVTYRVNGLHLSLKEWSTVLQTFWLKLDYQVAFWIDGPQLQFKAFRHGHPTHELCVHKTKTGAIIQVETPSPVLQIHRRAKRQ